MAWFDLTSVAFAVVTAVDPTPDDPAREPYDQLRVGTLDGRVAAELHLTTRRPDQGDFMGTWGNGPYGTDVLIGEDDGTTARLYLVSALDGGIQPAMLETSDAVGYGALDPARELAYYVPIDRESHRDRGLWRMPVSGGEARQVIGGPLMDIHHDFATTWDFTWSSDGTWLVAAGCNREDCTAWVHRPGDASSRRDGDRGELVGVTDGHYVTRDRMSNDVPLTAVSLTSGMAREIGSLDALPIVAGVPGAWYLVWDSTAMPGIPPQTYFLDRRPLFGGPPEVVLSIQGQPLGASTFHAHPSQDFGVALPLGWVLRWPPEGGPMNGVPPHIFMAGELVNVISGERVQVPPIANVDIRRDCEPIPPSTLPSGAEPGEPIVVAAGHWLFATWGSGADQVVQVVGALYSMTSTLPGPPWAVTIRGIPGALASQSPEGPYAIGWQEGDCLYEIQLPPGTTEQQARDYAARY